jgi:hypothetical protein
MHFLGKQLLYWPFSQAFFAANIELALQKKKA